ncbi:MAG: AAA family ATPase [Desulfovibrio sp.]|jgi:uncharacterized protein YhaN|nr:AAA family ATPase [Desulfovibrio sp.]
MYIESFKIDGFGIFSGAGAEAISPGLSIFLGQNEAGKSTCLEFLRVMLTGYPASNAECDKFDPLRGGRPGGSLVLCVDKGKRLHLTRRRGGLLRDGGILTLTNADGLPESADALRQLLHGISAAAYSQNFGFSLRELQAFDADALSGASFGAGLVSPAVAIKTLDKEMDAICRKGGNYPKLHDIAERLQAIGQRMREIESECARYDDFAEKLEQKDQELTRIRRRRKAVNEERHQLQRRLAAWEHWRNWRMVDMELERLGQNSALLDALPQLSGLSQHGSRFIDAHRQLPQLEELREQAQENIDRALGLLGEDWSCERIHKTDRSLFAREDVEKKVLQRNAALLTHQAAVDALDKANSDVQAAGREVDDARKLLARLPAPTAVFTEEERDALRRALDRLDNIREQLPEKKRVFQISDAAFAGACESLRLSRQAGLEAHQILDGLRERQGEAKEIADEVRKRLHAAHEAALAVSRSEEDLEKLTERMKLLREERHVNAPTHEDLNTRAKALHTLRALFSAVTAERERLNELDGRLESERMPSPVKSLPLIVIGLALIALGAGVLLAHWKFGLTALPITETLTAPISLWSGYLVLACGAAFLAGGLPRNGPEVERYKLEKERLQNRRDTCALHLAELEAKAESLCAASGVEDMHPITLDAAEMLLERERANCITEEYLQKEMDALNRQMEAVRANIQNLSAASRERENEVQQVRRRWQDFMLSLHVATVPSPEDSAAFFAGAESARIAFDGMSRARDDLAGLEELRRAQEQALRAVPAVAESLSGEEDCDAVVDLVRQMLDSCKTADMARVQRVRAETDLQNSERRQKLAGDRQREAMEQLRSAEEKLHAARDAWNLCIQGLGLGENLEPETVRNAFTYMENCLASEAELKRAQTGLVKNHEAQAALRDPLKKLLDALGRLPVPDTQGEPDWVTTLDLTLKDAQETAETHKELATRKQVAEDALRLAAGQTPLRQFLASFSMEEREKLEGRDRDLEEEYGALESAEQETGGDVAVLAAKVRELSTTDELSELRQQEANLQENLQRMYLDWCRHALARELITQAKQVFQQERQPHVIRDASKIFENITGGRWRGISVSLDDAGLYVLPGQGEALPPEALSRGTQEQVYLALRLAHIKNHAVQACALPLIMDEVLVNFDRDRAKRTAKAFVRLTEGGEHPAHQLLYFTCHPHTVDILRAVAPEAVLFTIEDGNIRRA